MKRATLKQKKEEIQEQLVIQKWLKGLKKNSKKNYLNGMALFCIINNKTPQELLDVAWKEQNERVPPWEQQIETWYDNFKEYFNEHDYGKYTAASRKQAVTNFFHSHKIQTPTDNVGRRNKNKLKVKNQREGLTKEDIKDALNTAKSYKLKALILTQATSGLSMVDVLNLNVDQFYDGLIKLDDGHEICRVYLGRTKTEREHYTFIGYEAVELIKKYLELERKDPMEGPLFAGSKTNNKRYTESSYMSMINRINERLGWNTEKWSFNKLTSHMLRKFFETQITDSGMIHEHVTHMMGWKIEGMKAHYYLAHPEELQKSYIKHLDYLTLENVETITIESPKVKEIKNELNRERETRKKELEAKDEEMTEMRKKMGLMDEMLKKILKKQLEK